MKVEIIEQSMATIAFTDLMAGEFLASDTDNIGFKNKDGGITWIAGPERVAAGWVTDKHNIIKGKRYRRVLGISVTVAS